MLKGRGFALTVCLYFIMPPPLIHFAGNHPSAHASPCAQCDSWVPELVAEALYAAEVKGDWVALA